MINQGDKVYIITRSNNQLLWDKPYAFLNAYCGFIHLENCIPLSSLLFKIIPA